MLQSSFKQYAEELDSFNATKESVYKLARDLTQAGKKQIFFLHRQRLGDGHAKVMTHLDTARSDIRDISSTLLYPLYRLLSPELVSWEHVQLGLKPGDTSLERPNPLSLSWVVLDKYSFALEEQLEGITFYWFLRYGTLMTLNEVNSMVHEDLIDAQKAFYSSDAIVREYSQKQIVVAAPKRRKQDSEPVSTSPMKVVSVNAGLLAEIAIQALPADLPIQLRELLLGYWDLSGEIMRFATMNPSKLMTTESGPHSITVSAFCASFVCEMKGQLDLLASQFSRPLGLNYKTLSQKSKTLTDSVTKIENLCYEWSANVAEYGEDNMLRILQLQADREEPVEE